MLSTELQYCTNAPGCVLDLRSLPRHATSIPVKVSPYQVYPSTAATAVSFSLNLQLHYYFLCGTSLKEEDRCV